MREPEEDVEVIDLLTTEDLMRRFKKTKITIEKWRNTRGLPYVRIVGTKMHAIRYREEKVKRWAKDRGKEYVCPRSSTRSPA